MWARGQCQFPELVREGSVALHILSQAAYLWLHHIHGLYLLHACFIKNISSIYHGASFEILHYTGAKAASFEILPNLCIHAFSLYHWLGKDSSFFLVSWSHSLLFSLMIFGWKLARTSHLCIPFSWVTVVIIQQSCWLVAYVLFIARSSLCHTFVAYIIFPCVMEP